MRIITALFCVAFLATGCEKITHTDYLTASLIEPENEIVEVIGDLEHITISFSQDVRRESAEQSFSLTAGGVDVSGYFEWPNSRTLNFTPYEGFYPYIQYETVLSTDTEDIFGNSLEENFFRRFSSSSDRQRPHITSITPAYFETVTDPFIEVEAVFDEPVLLSSFLNGVSISPSVKGIWTWDPLYTRFLYHPTEAYAYNEQYTLTFKNTITDLSGNNIESEISHIFMVEGDDTAPQLTQLSNDSDITIIEFAPYLQVENWECSDSIHLTFSEPVDRLSLEAGITIEPTWDFVVEEIDTDHYVLESESDLIWDTLYLITLDEKITDIYDNQLEEPYNIYIHTNGEDSRHPVVNRAVLYSYNPGENPPVILEHDILYDVNNKNHFHTVPFGLFDPPPTTDDPDIDGFVDIYFELSENAHIDFYTFVDNFVINAEDENVTDFMLWHAEMLPELTEDPFWGTFPPVEDMNDFYIVRAYLDITNDDSGVGYITVKLRGGFTDSLGNELSPSWETQVWGTNSP